MELVRTLITKKVSDIAPEEGGGQTAKAFLPSCVPELELEGEILKRNCFFVIVIYHYTTNIIPREVGFGIWLKHHGKSGV